MEVDKSKWSSLTFWEIGFSTFFISRVRREDRYHASLCKAWHQKLSLLNDFTLFKIYLCNLIIFFLIKYDTSGNICFLHKTLFACLYYIYITLCTATHNIIKILLIYCYFIMAFFTPVYCYILYYMLFNLSLPTIPRNMHYQLKSVFCTNITH